VNTVFKDGMHTWKNAHEIAFRLTSLVYIVFMWFLLMNRSAQVLIEFCQCFISRCLEFFKVFFYLKIY
jgi:hypothetical protein